MGGDAVSAVVSLAEFEAASGAARRALAAEVDAICRRSGFLAIRDHGVRQETIDEVWSLAEAFFDYPEAVKATAAGPSPSHPYGYFSFLSEALAKSEGVETPPDLKESFNCGPFERPKGVIDPEYHDFCYAETPWPEEPKGFQVACRRYFEEMNALAGRVMALFAEALGRPGDYFEPALSSPVSAMRILNYPEQDTAPAPGQLRAGAHTDYGSLTILLQKDFPPGLQIQSADGGWEPAPFAPGAFIVNIGDLLARWTNDRWVSTRHRVANPQDQEKARARRQSIAFFHMPNWDAEIAPISVEGADSKYAAVLAGPHLMSKFQRSKDV